MSEYKHKIRDIFSKYLGSLIYWLLIMILIYLSLPDLELSYSNIDEMRENALEHEGRDRNIFIATFSILSIALLGWRSWSAHTQAQNTTKAIKNTNRQLEIMANNNAQTLYEKGVMLLGNDSITQNIAGIHALEKLANQYPEEYLKIIIQLLADYVKYESWPAPKEMENFKFPDGTDEDIKNKLLESIKNRNSRGVYQSIFHDFFDENGIFDPEMPKKKVVKLHHPPKSKLSINVALNTIIRLRKNVFFPKISLTEINNFDVLSINNAYICGIEIKKEDLCGLMLENEKNSIIDFNGTIFYDTKFENCDLNHLYIYDCYFINSSIYDCQIKNSDFENTNLSYSTIHIYDEVNTNFKNAVFYNSRIIYNETGKRKNTGKIYTLFTALEHANYLIYINGDSYFYDEPYNAIIYFNEWKRILQKSKLREGFEFSTGTKFTPSRNP